MRRSDLFSVRWRNAREPDVHHERPRSNCPYCLAKENRQYYLKNELDHHLSSSRRLLVTLMIAERRLRKIRSSNIPNVNARIDGRSRTGDLIFTGRSPAEFGYGAERLHFEHRLLTSARVVRVPNLIESNRIDEKTERWEFSLLGSFDRGRPSPTNAVREDSTRHTEFDRQ